MGSRRGCGAGSTNPQFLKPTLLEALRSTTWLTTTRSDVDLRGTLSPGLAKDAYQVWDNKLHPTEKGFSAITDEFAHAVSKLP